MLNGAGDYTSAADCLQQAASIVENDYEVVLAAAESLFNDKQYLRASSWSQKAVELAKNDIEALVLAPKIARQRGRAGAAIEYLKYAMQLNNNDYTLHVELGKLYLENNLYEQAQR